jgi:rubrerythrin
LAEEMLPKVFIEFYDHLLEVIQEGNLSYNQLDGKLKEVASGLVPKIDLSLKKYGVCVEDFIIMQFIKSEELKDRLNVLAAEGDKFNNTIVNADRDIELMKKQEEINLQKMKMDKDRAEHQISIQKMDAEFKADIEKMDYETKGVSYKELREMDREDVRTLAEAAAKVEEAVQLPQDTLVVIKSDNKGKCQHCDGDITEKDIFCPICKKRLV